MERKEHTAKQIQQIVHAGLMGEEGIEPTRVVMTADLQSAPSP